MLQSRTALTALAVVASDVEHELPDLVARVRREIERIESTSIEFAQMRAAHLVSTRAAKISADDEVALERLLSPGSAERRLGVEAGADIAAAAIEAAGRWRGKANDPLAGPTRLEIFEAAARTAEAIYASTAG